MIKNRTLSEKNDVLIIQYEISVASNYIKLKEYSLNVVSNNAHRLDIKFRVSSDSYIYTQWEDLTESNFSKIEGRVINNIFFIQFRFEVIEIADNDIIKIKHLTVSSSINSKTIKSEIIDKTIFSGLSIGNFEVSRLCSNLLVKLIDKGIIPSYINRSEINSDDYKAFWSSVATYMSMFVTYINKFENIFFDRNLLIYYINQLDINVREHRETLEDLQKIIINYYRNIQLRGTSLVFKRKNILTDIDGEILRLFNVSENDEFYYQLRSKNRTGIITNRTSPLYKGVYADAYNKIDFSKLEQHVGGTASFSEYNVVLTAGQYIGFDEFGLSTVVSDKGYIVDTDFSYIFTVDAIFVDANIDFGCRAFDENNNKYELNRYDDLSFNSFFAKNKNINGQNIILKGIIYANSIKQGNLYSDSELKRLIFNNKNIKKISPYIKVNSGSVYINDISLNILNYNYSSGFIGNSNFIDIFVKNNSHDSELSIKNKIRQKMIPYNANVLFNIPNEKYKENIIESKPKIKKDFENLPT